MAKLGAAMWPELKMPPINLLSMPRQSIKPAKEKPRQVVLGFRFDMTLYELRRRGHNISLSQRQ
jgi:hypothetical protein